MEEMLELATKVDGLDGLELVGNWHVNDENIHEVGQMFADAGMEIPMLVPDLWTQAKWGRGSLAAPDEATRRAAVDEVKKVMDWAAELDCPYIDVWPGQDGFDYPLQADYVSAWKWLRDGLTECAGYNDQVRILVEYKPREPRCFCFVDHVGTVLTLLQDMERVGVLLDVGHSLQGRENVSQSAALLAEYGKLDYMHINDNYRDWDDDMLVGSIHAQEYLELAYWLRKLDYQGWLTLDIFPYRELDKVNVAVQCKKNMEFYLDAVDRVGLDRIEQVVASADALQVAALIRDELLGG
jgi:xylose isomerase